MAPTTLNPKIERLTDNRDRLGETPLWCDRTGKLWWIDIEEPKLQSFDPETSAHEVIEFDCTYLGSLALTKSGQMLVAMDLSLALFDPESGTLTPLAELERDIDNRLNDGRVDAKGRFWVGSMDNGLKDGNGALYRVDPDGSVSKHARDIIVSNGIAHTPDNRTMYLTDTRRYTSWAFDMDPEEGTLSNRRVFADYSDSGDRPDGACIDADGCLWTAFFAGARVVRYRPDGEIDLVIPLPVTNTTCLCFGGKDYKTLYVTSAWKFLSQEQLDAEPMAGGLFAIEGVGQGLPENRFG